MKRFVFASLIAGSVLLASSFSAIAHNGEDHSKGGQKAATGEEAKQVTLIGEVIDTACFTASEGDAKGKDHAACAQKCMATGIPAGILPEGKGEDNALVMLTNPAPFAPYAAQTVKVEGVVNDEKKLVDVKKAYVKDGETWKEIQLNDEHHKMGGDAEKKDDMKSMDMKGADRGAHGGHDKK